jgi:carboxylate-amine ligase
MADEMEFGGSAGNTVGVELELQILNTRDFNLARDADDLLDLVEKTEHVGAVKPEITESMIEVNSSIHERHETLLAELRGIRDAVSGAAQRLNLRVAGGGSHPFHKWTERRIYPTDRFKHLLDLYGYLAKQFTIFGQHIHLGCPSGDDALYLLHMLSRYVPHFIALSASSPFQQGEDTAYQSSRLNTVSAFPLSGQAPFIHAWGDFAAYFYKMRDLQIVESMKDFYWDIRPKPEYGTVEIRVLDTPLTVERAALLAAYAQALAHYFLSTRPREPLRDVYLFYSYNRFQACRYGLSGIIADAYTQQRVELKQDIVTMLSQLAPHAQELGSTAALEELTDLVRAQRTDAGWLRTVFTAHGTMNDVARLQSDLWMGRNEGALPINGNGA